MKHHPNKLFLQIHPSRARSSRKTSVEFHKQWWIERRIHISARAFLKMWKCYSAAATGTLLIYWNERSSRTFPIWLGWKSSESNILGTPNIPVAANCNNISPGQEDVSSDEHFWAHDIGDSNMYFLRCDSFVLLLVLVELTTRSIQRLPSFFWVGL